jgi:hypothetical protein
MIQSPEFRDGGAGRLPIVLAGKIRATNDQFQALAKQVNGRVGARQDAMRDPSQGAGRYREYWK